MGICEAMDQKFLVPIFAVRGAMDQIFLIHSCLWNHELGTFDHLYLFVEPRGWAPDPYTIFFLRIASLFDLFVQISIVFIQSHFW